MAIKVTEPSVGTSLSSDAVGGEDVLRYRDQEFSTWSDIPYKAVATPGTAELAQANTPCRGLYIVGMPMNAGVVAIGPSSSTKADPATFRGMPVFPGQAVPVPVTNTNLVYVDNLAGDKWALVYFTHTDS